MARILLANFDEVSGTRLMAFLRGQRHEAHLAAQDTSISQVLSCMNETDLVIVDGSHREQYTRDLVARIASRRVGDGLRPMMLCICRSYRGPQFEMDLEKKGAHVIYV